MHTEKEILELKRDITNKMTSYINGEGYNGKDLEYAMKAICAPHYKKLDKEWYLLKRIEEVLDKKIKRGASSAEVVHYLPTIMLDIKRDIKENGISLTDPKEEAHIKGTKDVVLAKVFEYSNLTREELLVKEQELDQELKSKAGIFSRTDSRGRIVGALNKGMYGKTSGDFIKFLSKNGVNIKEGDRFTDYMSDDLLRFRLAGLYISRVYCDKVYKNLNNDFGPTITQAGESDFEYTEARTKQLGSIIKDLYKEYSKKTPYEEIKDTSFEYYPVIKGTFPNR